MNAEERRLADLLDRLVPEPRRLTVDDIRVRRPIRVRTTRWAPVLAAAAVAVIAVMTSLVAVEHPFSRRPSVGLGGGQSGKPAVSHSARSTPTASPSTGGNPVCAVAQLKVGVTGSTVTGSTVTPHGGVPPVVGEYLGFTNVGATPCRLSGWPAVTGVTAAGGAVPAQHIVGSYLGLVIATPPVVVLRPGERAYAALYAEDLSASGASPCLSPSYRVLRIIPPGGGKAKGVTMSARLPGGRYAPACNGLQVAPVVGPALVPATAR